MEKQNAIWDHKSSQNLLKVEVRLGRIRIVFEQVLRQKIEVHILLSAIH